ncbi:hypothetical protein MNBD_GAMMA10-1109 [hydrothermal vent metagenome]|uniref:Uncharacterized protein n=1 Tax=hydrothermal vent metagenome TaxID=652676 RepID=A0A3B0Y0V4_9ZZZZ
MKIIISLLCLLVSASSFASDAEKLKQYLSNNKIGNSTDYGIFKNNTDHVITIHGFDQDLPVCLEIEKKLNIEQPNTYTCKPLNY